MASSADIAIFGGAAFGGKTYALEIEPLRHVHNKSFGAVIFRRTTTEITREGGLWHEAGNIYPLFDAAPNSQEHSYRFPSGAKVAFAGMQYEQDKYTWKSAQITLLCFDQLEMFTPGQFFYMFSRNRSTSGIRPYIRASANPEPGWLADFLDWWIDEEGWAIPERSGHIRWMVRENDVTYWGDTKEQLQAEHPHSTPKSVTFILSTLYDNQIGMEKDPGYIANIQAQDNIERMRLFGDRDGHRGGNWKIKPAAGKVFNKSWFEIVDAVPMGGQIVRAWDLAATAKKTANSTASNKGKILNGIIYILDATNEKTDPAVTDAAMLNTASQDGKEVAIRFEQEGGASGKRDAHHIVTMLAGYDARGVLPQGDKILRAKPLAAQALAGNVKLLRGAWNDRWLNSMHAQDGSPDTEDDDMDAASLMYNEALKGATRKQARSMQG